LLVFTEHESAHAFDVISQDEEGEEIVAHARFFSAAGFELACGFYTFMRATIVSPRMRSQMRGEKTKIFTTGDTGAHRANRWKQSQCVPGDTAGLGIHVCGSSMFCKSLDSNLTGTGGRIACRRDAYGLTGPGSSARDAGHQKLIAERSGEQPRSAQRNLGGVGAITLLE